MEKIIVRMATGMALGFGISGLGILVIGLFAARDYYVDGDYFRLCTVALFGIAFGLVALTLAVRSRLVVHHDYVEKRELRTVRILFESVDKLELHSDGLVLHSGKSKIAVETSGALRDRAHSAILNRLQGRTEMDVVGEPHLVEAFRLRRRGRNNGPAAR